MKWDNSVLPWLIIWKRAALNPPKNKPKVLDSRARICHQILVWAYPQVPLDGSAEPLENWLSNKEGKSAF